MTEETQDERRARKARERAAMSEKVLAEIPTHAKSLDAFGFNELAMEHTRLRTRIMEVQQLAITGKVDVKAAQDFERALVEQIHKVEERARGAQSGGQHVPKKGT